MNREARVPWKATRDGLRRFLLTIVSLGRAIMLEPLVGQCRTNSTKKSVMSEEVVPNQFNLGTVKTSDKQFLAGVWLEGQAQFFT